MIFLFSFFNLSYPEKSWNYYYQKGLKQYTYEMYDYAIYSFTVALQLNNKNYQSANFLGEIYLIKNNRQKALKYFLQSVSIKRTQPDTLLKIALIHEFFAERKKTFKLLKESIKYNPKHIAANIHIVRYYIKKKKIKKAEFHLAISQKIGSIKAKSYYKDLKYNLNEANNHLKNNYTLAIKYYKTIKNYKQSSINILKKQLSKYKSKYNYNAVNIILAKLGIIYIKRAIIFYKKVLQVNPADLSIYLKIANLYRKFKQYDKAIIYLEKLKFIKPNYGLAYSLLGNLYFSKKTRRKKYYLKLAAKNLEKAITLQNDNSENYILLNRIYTILGNKTKAKYYEAKGTQ